MKFVIAFGLDREEGGHLNLIDMTSLDLDVVRDELEHIRPDANLCRSLTGQTILADLVALIDGIDEHLKNAT